MFFFEILFCLDFSGRFDTSGSMIAFSDSVILALGGFCDEDEQELGILHSSSWMWTLIKRRRKPLFH